MSKKKNQQHPLVGEIESALSPGSFVSYYHMSSFVEDLEAVSSTLTLLTRDDPSSAAKIFEIFIAACYEKAEEIDDSGGEFGQFVGSLFCNWIKARQAAGSNAEETVAALLGWMENDPYCFAYSIEKDTSRVLNKDGLAAFVKAARFRFDTATELRPEDAKGDQSEYRRRRWATVLRALYLAKNDVSSYTDLAEQTGMDARDCHEIAALLSRKRKYTEALSWIERGIEIEGKSSDGSAGYDLKKLNYELLVKLGRDSDLIEAIWNEYQSHPGKYEYADLMKAVPLEQKKEWHEKAIESAIISTDADLGSIIELLIETKEVPSSLSD